eukprot:jgi/Tetstr1/435630/TSEL_024531.t1
MFGARGQIDLIDYQSSEYKGYRFLLTYIDHGIKFCFCTPIPNKEQPSKIIGLSEEEAKEVIESTRKLLPACQMEQQTEEQARQEQQPQEQEDMDVCKRQRLSQLICPSRPGLA